MDGSGYPKGLTSDEIHLFGKIVAIADMFDALTTERCYRKSMSNFHAYKILTNDASNNKIDSTLLALLLKVMCYLRSKFIKEQKCFAEYSPVKSRLPRLRLKLMTRFRKVF